MRKCFLILLLICVMAVTACNAESISVSKSDIVDAANQVVTAYQAMPERFTPLLVIRTYMELKTLIVAQEGKLVRDLTAFENSGVDKGVVEGLTANYKSMINEWDTMLGNTEETWQSWLEGKITDEECSAVFLKWIQDLSEMK